MTVLLLGIGADSTNTSPVPRVHEDGRFEYIPIPEKMGRDGTTETRTYGNTMLRHEDAPLSEYLDHIKPDTETRIRGEKMETHPLHHDPNFESLTYGETTSRPAYTKRLKRLEEGDIAAFYTGLRNDEDRFTHRYIIGYFTVNEILDFENLDDGKAFSEMTERERDELMRQHSENAHAKRYEARGELEQKDGLIIVDGKQRGGLLEKAFRISKHAGGCHHYLRDSLQRKFEPEPGGNGERNAYLGGVKQAHVLGIGSEEFVEMMPPLDDL